MARQSISCQAVDRRPTLPIAWDSLINPCPNEASNTNFAPPSPANGPMGLAVLWFFRTKGPVDSAVNTKNASLSNDVSGGGHRRLEADRSAAPLDQGLQGAVKQDSGNTATNVAALENSKFYKEWKRPISFYGMVIDENTNPVAGADKLKLPPFRSLFPRRTLDPQLK
jgi:hypothetical protein